MSKQDFFKNELVVNAIIRQLEIIGEAAKNISVELKQKYRDIPWK